MQTNHPKATTVAAAVPFPAIRQEITEMAAAALTGARDLSGADRQFLKDLQRAERYQAKWLARFVSLLARCERDTDAFRFSETLGAFVRAARPRPIVTLSRAIEDETFAQGDADMAELYAVMHQEDESALRRCECALCTHRATIEIAIEAIQTRRIHLAGATA